MILRIEIFEAAIYGGLTSSGGMLPTFVAPRQGVVARHAAVHYGVQIIRALDGGDAIVVTGAYVPGLGDCLRRHYELGGDTKIIEAIPWSWGSDVAAAYAVVREKSDFVLWEPLPVNEVGQMFGRLPYPVTPPDYSLPPAQNWGDQRLLAERRLVIEESRHFPLDFKDESWLLDYIFKVAVRRAEVIRSGFAWCEIAPNRELTPELQERIFHLRPGKPEKRKARKQPDRPVIMELRPDGAGGWQITYPNTATQQGDE